MFSISFKVAATRFIALSGKVTFKHKEYISVSCGCREKS